MSGPRIAVAGLAAAFAIVAPRTASSVPSSAPGPASGACTSSLEDWEIVRGTLHEAGACGAYLAATDGQEGSFSYGDFLYQKPMRAPLDMEVAWRRIGPESGKSLELRVMGALLLFRDDEYGIYVWNEASFTWRPLPGYRVHDEHRLRVHQTASAIQIWVDEKPLETYRLDMGGEHQVGIAAKGGGGYRSWFAFRGFRAVSQASEGRPR